MISYQKNIGGGDFEFWEFPPPETHKWRKQLMGLWICERDRVQVLLNVEKERKE